MLSCSSQPSAIQSKNQQSLGTERHCSPEGEEQAVRSVRTEPDVLGARDDTAQRVCELLGYGIESLRTRVSRVNSDDGLVGGMTTVCQRRESASPAISSDNPLVGIGI